MSAAVIASLPLVMKLLAHYMRNSLDTVDEAATQKQMSMWKMVGSPIAAFQEGGKFSGGRCFLVRLAGLLVRALRIGQRGRGALVCTLRIRVELVAGTRGVRYIAVLVADARRIGDIAVLVGGAHVVVVAVGRIGRPCCVCQSRK